MAYNGETTNGLSCLLNKRHVLDLWQPRGKSRDIKKTMNLTRRQQAILVGTLLGDACLQKTGEKNARLRLEQGEKQKEYLFWKTKQFPKLFNKAPGYIERTHPKTKKTYAYWRAQSHSSPVLGSWHTLFYKDGAKYFPKDLAELLTLPLSLAVWYMDDGYYSLKERHSFIYLGRVSRSEAEIAKEAIKINFNLLPRVYDKKQKGFALFFSVAETKKLHKLIESEMIDSMTYKLAP